jgi:ribosome-binding protein aMBF1 (putative translation factor)
MGAKLTETQLAFLEWLVDPAPASPQGKGSQNDLAVKLGVSRACLSKWKSDIFFKEAWEKRLAELNVSPDRIQKVVEAMYRNAIGGDVKSANLYLQYVDRFTPTKRTVVEDRSTQDLSDEELAAALEENVVQLRRKQA